MNGQDLRGTAGEGREELLKRALVELRRLRARLAEAEGSAREPIAIVGLGCRFPGADGPEALWRLLRDERDVFRAAPVERWGGNGDASLPHGAFLDDVDRFDADFFGISPREASRMDPQQRLTLEVAWEAFEDAGQSRASLRGSRSGVFVGVSYAEYRGLQAAHGIDAYDTLGAAHAAVANRLSYVLDLQGPSLAVDTLCSSSLVALHLACRSLRSKECDLAVGGGVFVMAGPDMGTALGKMGALAPDGRCKPFSARADGFGRGEGCGLVVLKRLSDALRDGDRIRAVIRGSAVNQCGHSQGMSAPNGLAQEAVIREALADAELEPEDVDFVEAHGTGTILGDPIEVGALAAVFGNGAGRESPCRLGAVKAQLGHLEPAAGVAGLVRTVLCLEHETLTPLPNLGELNPDLVPGKMPFVVPTEAEPWPASGRIRRAGVSSFGMGGSNAHVVIEEAPRRAREDAAGDGREDAPDRPLILPLSAQSPEALDALAGGYRRLLEEEVAGGETRSEVLRDIVFSSATRRTHHRHRLALVARSGEELAAGLAAFPESDGTAVMTRGEVLPRPPAVIFVFSGQGSQWPGMGTELAATEPVFRRCLERCDEILRHEASWSLLDELRAYGEKSRLARTEIAQPALFALQVALVELLASWGVRPEAVIGHSVGEVAAAHVAGVLSLEDALRVVVRRGRSMAGTAGQGGMAAVGFGLETARELIEPFADRLGIAACNGRDSTVISGEVDALREVLEIVERREIFGRRVKVDYAFHSPQMDACAEELARSLEGLGISASRVPILSTVQGGWAEDGDFCAAYWARNVRQPVLFAQALDVALGEGFGTCVEVGGHPVLTPAISAELRRHGGEGLAVPTLRRHETEPPALLGTVATLYTRGYEVDWRALAPAGRFFPRLPRYPWQRRSFWLEPRAGRSVKAVHGASGGPLLGDRQRAEYRELELQAQPGRHATAYLRDHRVHGVATVPAAAYVEMALEAADEAFGVGSHELEGLAFVKGLFLSEEDERPVRIVLECEGDRARWEIASRPPGESEASWTVHGTGTAVASRGRAGRGPASTVSRPARDLAEIRRRCGETIDAGEHYRAAARRGLEYGPAFQGVEEIRRGEGEVLGRVVLPAAADPGDYRVHPALLDACFQLLLCLLPDDDPKATWLPVELERIRVEERSAVRGWAHIRLRAGVGETSRGADISVLDDAGRVLVELGGLTFLRLDERRAEDTEDRGWLYRMRWEPQPLAASSSSKSQELAGAWLLFNDGGELGAALAARLAGRGGRVVEVLPGKTFERLGPTAWQVRSREREDFDRLARELVEAGETGWRGVVHLWSQAVAPVEDRTSAETLADLATASWIGFTGWLRDWLRSLPEGSDERPGLWWVTRGAHRAVDGDAVAVSQATLVGLGRTLSAEHPELRVHLVDLCSGRGDGGPPDSEIDSLWRELLSRSEENQVALRPEGRFVARLARTTVESPSEGVHLRADGTYLITGGLGGLGLAVAGRLVARGARHLALMGRGAPSPEARMAIETMEAAGARVEVAAADVADEGQVAEVLARLTRALPPLAGVVHAAGVLDDGLFLDLTPARYRTVLAPKVAGAWNLHRLTRDLDPALDFFVLFASVAGALGSPGQANYAAANAFLDALAESRRAAGLPGLAVDWGPWSEVGMAASDTLDESFERSGFGRISPREGLDVLEGLLGGAAGQVLAMPFDVSAWSRSAVGMGSPRLAAGLEWAEVAPPGVDGLRAALLEAPAEGRGALLEEELRRALGRQLGMAAARVDARRPLQELGVDSLVAVELSGRLEDTLGVRLPVVRFFQKSVAELAPEILARMTEAPAAEVPAPSVQPVVSPGRDGSLHPLSYPQEGLWVEYQLDRSSWAYNAIFALRVASPVDADALRRCYQRLVDRHGALRSTYREVDGKPVQEVHVGREVPFTRVDAAGWSDGELHERLEEEARRPFDLERGPALRILLFSRAVDDHRLLFVAHHIALDLRSFGVLYRELGILYAAETAGEEAVLPPVAADYPDYVHWQRRRLEGPEGQRLESYWRERLAGEIRPLALPFDRPRPELRTLDGAAEFITLDPSLVARARALAEGRRTSLFVVLLASFYTLLHRITGQTEIVVSSPMGGRSRKEFLDMVGHFVNAVPLRCSLAGDLTFDELLGRVQEAAFGAVDHQDYPSSLMVQRLMPSRRDSQTSLFDVEFLLNTASIDQGGMSLTLARPGARWNLGGLSVETVDLTQQAGQFELGVELYETGEGLSGMVQYRPDLFEATTVRHLLGQLEVLLAAAMDSPEERIGALPLTAGAGSSGGEEAALPRTAEDELDDLASEVLGELDSLSTGGVT